ncbi:MAG TPA: hypothetical protein PLP33_27845 [Leptospiraceae bacterium]|nr:hypothetical protein [Leptospiraceae bacterium]
MEFKLDTTKLTDDGNYVLKTGLIFRAGEYEDKNFTMTPEEIIDAEAAFEEVPLDIEHNENMGLLEGELGSLVAVQASENGEELYGTAKIPLWLDTLNKKKSENQENSNFKVSCTWDRKDKKLKKLAIVKNPRVSDAALMAAFTEDKINKSPDTLNESVAAFFSWAKENESAHFGEKTWDGKWTMQSVHDSMARSGAICKQNKAKKAEAEFVSKEESVAIQKMHDLAVENGAKCSFIDEKWANYSKDEASSKKTNKFGRKLMTFKDIKAFFQNAPDDVVEELDSKFNSEGEDAEKKALKLKVAELTSKLAEKEEKPENFSKETEVDAEKEQLKLQVAQLQKRNLESDAEKFADNLIKDNKIKPVSKEAVIAMFMQATTDDGAVTATEVNFSNDKVCKTRVEVLAEFFSSLEGHKLTTEELAAKKPNVLTFGKGDSDAPQTDVKAAVEATKAYAEQRNKTLRAKK